MTSNLVLESKCSSQLVHYISHLLWWHVYWYEGGTTCHSHETNQ